MGVIYGLLFLMVVSVDGRALTESEGKLGKIDSLQHGQRISEDSAGPSHYLTRVHEPTARESMIHHLSTNILDITKDLLSYKPRSRQYYNITIHAQKEVLSRLDQHEVSELLFHKGLFLPPPYRMECDPNAAHYRTLDGSCNNFRRPCWGKTDEPYRRWLQPVYANGVDAPRVRYDGRPLPNPRLVYQWVSSQNEPTDDTLHPQISNLFVAWGQLLAHEIALTPTVTRDVLDASTGDILKVALKCCGEHKGDPECLSITMDYNDGFYRNGHCMNIVRSAAYTYSPLSCVHLKLGGPREQMNQVTPFLDASVVYGASEKIMRQLRELRGGGASLSVDVSSGWSCPLRRNAPCKSSFQECDNRCFHTGEKRSNENPVLSALHTLFVREHNRLVAKLRSRGWPEDTLFHVVRKIVGALMQHITYNEYLPVVIGRAVMDSLRLTVPSSPDYKYNSSVDPTPFNSFVTAAFRFGHSMVSSRLQRAGTAYSSSPLLSQDFFSVEDFCYPRADPVASLLSGQASQRAQKVDNRFSRQLTNHLFAKQPNDIGLDIFSLNVQRGRDHGLPPYNRWREVCGLGKVRDYSELRQHIPEFVVDRLAAVYGAGAVDEVDLYVAGVSEIPMPGGLLGPTFTCIVANQFRNLKFGDRFWYENKEHAGSFTEEQIRSIQRTTLSSLICRNSDVKSIQWWPFHVESSKYPKVSCDLILQQTDIDLNLWP